MHSTPTSIHEELFNRDYEFYFVVHSMRRQVHVLAYRFLLQCIEFIFSMPVVSWPATHLIGIELTPLKNESPGRLVE